MATGISISSTSNLSSGQKILVAGAKLAFEPAAPNPDLIMSERIPQGHKQWDVLTYARLANASALTEGVDLSAVQQLVAASLSITPSEHGIIATLSNRLIRRQGDTAIVGTCGTMIANSLRRVMDADVITLYDGFSKSTPGTSNALDVTTFRGSVAYLLTDNDSAYGPAPIPLRASLHIEQISDIILDIAGTLNVTLPMTPRAASSTRVLLNWSWRTRPMPQKRPTIHCGLSSTASSRNGERVKEPTPMA